MTFNLPPGAKQQLKSVDSSALFLMDTTSNWGRAAVDCAWLRGVFKTPKAIGRATAATLEAARRNLLPAFRVSTTVSIPADRPNAGDCHPWSFNKKIIWGLSFSRVGDPQLLPGSKPAAQRRWRELNNKAKVTMRKSYGFRTFRTLELALYHRLGMLPKPESTHECF